MNVEADYSEVLQLAADLTGAAEKVGPKAQIVVRKSIRDVTSLGQRGAPVDTGFLRSSITHSDLRTTGSTGVIEAESGPTANYGGFVENGTSRMAPQPYMAPAASAVEPGFIQAIEQLGGEML